MSYTRNKDGNDFRNDGNARLHIAILGAGAIGSYYGVKLAMVGHQVEFLMRSGREETRKTGIKIDSVDGEMFLSTPRIPDSPESVGPVDVVIVTLKTTANASLPDLLPPLLGPNTLVLTLQNGMGNAEAIARIVDPARVFAGLCFIGVTRVRPGLVKHVTGGQIAMGALLPENSAMAARFATTLIAAGIPAKPVANIHFALWSKLVWNVPFNGLCIARGGIDVQALLAQPGAEAEVRQLMGEVIAAARACQIEIPAAFIDKQVEVTRAMGPYFPSTVLDFLAKRPIELDSIFAIPLATAKARQPGLQLPAWEALLTRLRELAAANS